MGENDILVHHGILGQKWGVRRYQYEDGSLTPEGKKRYGVGDGKEKSLQSVDTVSGNKRRKSLQSVNSVSTDNASSSGVYGGGGSAHDLSEIEKDEEEVIDELEAALLEFFNGMDSELRKYVTISRNLDDPSKSMFIVKDPITKTQVVFKPSEGGKMISYLSKKFGEAGAITEAANKRNAAVQKQDAARKSQELAKKTDAWKEQGSGRTEAAQRQDWAKKTDAWKEQGSARTTASQKQDEAKKRSPEALAKKRTEVAQKQDAAKKAAEKAAERAEFLAKEAEKIRILQEKEKEIKANKRTEAAKKQSSAKKNVSHSETYADTDDVLIHYGVLGMKWGIRRYQNEDGTLTEAGKARVNKKYSKGAHKLERYDRKVQKLNTKKNKLDEKIRKQDYKANRPKRLLETWGGYEKRLAKNQMKVQSSENKYRKLDWQTEKAYNKGAKYVEKMSKKFKDIDLSSVNQTDIDYVEDYLARVMDDKRRSSHSSPRRTSDINSRSSRKR